MYTVMIIYYKDNTSKKKMQFVKIIQPHLALYEKVLLPQFLNKSIN